MRYTIIIMLLILTNSCINTSDKKSNQADDIQIKNAQIEKTDLVILDCSDTVKSNQLTRNEKKEYLYKNKLFCGKVIDSIIHREGEQFNYIQEFSYEKGILNGPHIIYSYKGDTLLYGNYKNGQKNGVWTEFERNGDLLRKGKYVNNKMDSLWTYYFPFDQGISRIEFFNLGVKNGIYKRWHSNGLPYEFGFYKNDLKDSIWKTYSNLDYLKDSGNYKNGLKNGTWIERMPNGQYKNLKYKNDTIIE